MSSPQAMTIETTNVARISDLDICLSLDAADATQVEKRAAVVKRLASRLLLPQTDQDAINYQTIVTQLGAQLTSLESAPRQRATQLLSALLRDTCQQQSLPATQLHTFLTFFSSRLNDAQCIRDILGALHALVKHHIQQLTPEQVQQLIQRLVLQDDEFSCQSQVQSARKFVYDILTLCAQHHAQVLIQFDAQLVDAFTAAMDGEKDPRCLLVCFRFATFLFSRMPPKTALTLQHLEPLFEVTTCYFPITFTPPKNDTFGITSQDLKQALHRLMSCTPMLVEYTMPLLFDKTRHQEESDAGANPLASPEADERTLVDSLHVMQQCVESYGDAAAATMQPFLPLLWSDVLRRACLTPSTGSLDSNSPDSHTAALSFLRTLMSRLCPDTVAGFASLHIVHGWREFTQPILNEGCTELALSDSKSARQFSCTIAVLASSSTNAMRRVFGAVLPVVAQHLNNESVQPSQCTALLEFLNALVHLTHSSLAHLGPCTEHPLSEFKSQILALYETGINSSARVLAVAGFALVAGAAPASEIELLSESEVRQIIQRLTQLMFTDDSAAVRTQCIASLTSLALKRRASLVAELTLPSLLVLQDLSQSATSSDKQPHKTIWSVLSCISSLCSSLHLFGLILPHLLTLLRIQFNSAIAQPQPQNDAVRLTQAVLHCLCNVTQHHAQTVASGSQEEVQLQKILASLPRSVLALLVSGSLSITNQSVQPQATRRIDASIVKLSVQLLVNLTRLQPAEEQHAFIDTTCKLFLNGDFASIQSLSQPESISLNAQSAFRPLNASSSTPSAQLQLLPLLTAIVGAHRPTSSQPTPEHQAQLVQSSLEFMRSREKLSLPSAHEPVIQLLAALVNKMPAQQVDAFVDQVMTQQVAPLIHDEQQPLFLRLRALQALIWLTKALLQRSHRSSIEFARQLTALLHSPHPDLAQAAAHSFTTLLSDCDIVLCRQSFAQCGVAQLYKQRLFASLLPELLKHVDQSKEQQASGDQPMNGASTGSLSNSRSLVMLALLHLIARVPATVLASKRAVLLPLLMQALRDSQHVRLQQHALSTLKHFVSTDSALQLETHLDELVPSLCEAIQYSTPNANSAVDPHSLARGERSRLQACWLLKAIADQLPFASVVPHQSCVMRQLLSALDDPKRSVRQSAQQARNTWATAQLKT